ncbi:MAG: Hsp33 family molecular chaperone HslO [Clostridiales bacterium]|nr:Hsp33 family molecular chaperone HslO [Clostridiales bacterium]
MNKVIISMDKAKNFRVYLTDATNMVEKMRGIHNTTPTASAALGRTIIVTALMGLMLKGKDDKITAIIKGGGPAGQILSVADSTGRVKGYIENPKVDLPLNEKGKLDIGGAVGNQGTLTIIKDLGLKEPYIGQSQLVSGEIAEDFAAYFAYSEQQPSSVMTGVLVDRDLSIMAAGGCIVQLLPDADTEVIPKLEERIMAAPSMTDLITQYNDIHAVLNVIFEGFEMIIVEEKEISYECDCSRERMEKALISIGKQELERIIEEDGQAELICHFCLKGYLFDKTDLENIIKEVG